MKIVKAKIPLTRPTIRFVRIFFFYQRNKIGKVKILLAKKLAKSPTIFCGASPVKNRCSNERTKAVITPANGPYKNIPSKIGISLKSIFKN